MALNLQYFVVLGNYLMTDAPKVFTGAGLNSARDRTLRGSSSDGTALPYAPANVERNQSLDVLRGVAIFMVMLRHYLYPSRWFSFGWAGVDLFFVLSGFLIAGLLFSEYRRFGSIDLKRFWIRRGFKIYPGFYALVFFAIVEYAAQGQLTRHIFSDIFFLQDYIVPIYEPGWSLGVEEKFYFVLPLLLLLTMRLGKRDRDPFRFIPYFFLAVFAGCLAMRLHSVIHFTTWEASHRPAHLRADTLFLGVTLAYYKYFHSDSFRRIGRWPLWIPGIMLLAPLALWEMESRWTDTIGLGAVSLGFGLILIWAVNRTFPESAPLRMLAWVGRYSYSIYLWQFTLRHVLSYDVTGTLVLLPVYLAGSVALGWLGAYLIETPFLKLRDKYYPARGAALRVDDIGARLVNESLHCPGAMGEVAILERGAAK